jgi:hypothetical protein
MEKIDSQGIKLVVPSRKRPINNPGRLINVISRSITMLGRQGIPGDYGVIEEGTLIPAETMTATT